MLVGVCRESTHFVGDAYLKFLCWNSLRFNRKYTRLLLILEGSRCFVNQKPTLKRVRFAGGVGRGVWLASRQYQQYLGDQRLRLKGGHPQ